MKKRILSLVLAVFLVTLSSCKIVDERAPFSLGSVSENKYTNEFLGVTASFSDKWTFMSEEEMKELNKITEELLPEETLKQLESAEVIQDMQGTNSATGASVGVNFENLKLLGTLSLNEEKYLSAQTDAVKESLSQMGLQNLSVEVVDVTFAEREAKALRVEATLSGMNFYEYVVAVKEGSYMANITVAGMSDDELKGIIGLFKPIEE